MALWIDEFYSEPKENALDRILRGVTAYVEVWSGNENRCECVKSQLKSLGARVEEKFSAKVTHVVFNEGSLTTYKRAKSRNIPIVSVLWIEESKRLLKRACFKTFCALNLKRYEEPDIFGSPTKFKRPRHPRTSSNSQKVHKRKKQKTDKTGSESDPYETYFNPHLFHENAAFVKGGIMTTLEQVVGKALSETEEEDSIPCSQFTAEINESLTKKLYNRFLEEIKDKENTSENHLSSRQSCPPVIKVKNDPSNMKITTTFAREGMETLSINGTNKNEKQNIKSTQVPITFFFQASAASNKSPSLVFTGLSFDDMDILTNVVFNIGGFQVERFVNARCSHVVCGYPPKRTLNILRGIARGCWILSKDWVMKSLESNKWLDEEEFELNYFLPAIKKARISRQNGPPFHIRSLFSSCGPIYLGNGCSPPAADLKELISLCGGHVVSCSRAAKVVVVGQGKNNISSVSQRLSKPQNYVTEKWVLDSISEDSLCLFDYPYLVSGGGCRKSIS